MSKIPFKDLPFAVKAAVFVSFFTAWVMFEEFVIDRHGLWRYLPFYKVGLFCVWDVLALVVIGCGLAWFSSSRRSGRAPCAMRRSLHWCPACT
jgi:hypothetical protein